jgi:hypothetical protein
MTKHIPREDRTGTQPVQRQARVVISMKNVKICTREEHELLKRAVRDPQKAVGRVFPKI